MNPNSDIKFLQKDILNDTNQILFSECGSSTIENNDGFITENLKCKIPIIESIKAKCQIHLADVLEGSMLPSEQTEKLKTINNSKLARNLQEFEPESVPMHLKQLAEKFSFKQNSAKTSDSQNLRAHNASSHNSMSEERSQEQLIDTYNHDDCMNVNQIIARSSLIRIKQEIIESNNQQSIDDEPNIQISNQNLTRIKNEKTLHDEELVNQDNDVQILDENVLSQNSLLIQKEDIEADKVAAGSLSNSPSYFSSSSSDSSSSTCTSLTDSSASSSILSSEDSKEDSDSSTSTSSNKSNLANDLDEEGGEAKLPNENKKSDQHDAEYFND